MKGRDDATLEARARTAKKAIVVEDQEPYRRTYIRFFESSGFRVQSASTFQEASKLLETEFFHVASVDLSLVGDRNRDGLRIVRKIYEDLREGTEAILLSAYGTMEDGANARRYGAFEVIEKENVTLSSFEDLIERAYQKSHEALSRVRVGLNFLAGPGNAVAISVWTAQVLEAFSAGGFEYVDSMVRRLLANLAPLLRSKTNRQAELDRQLRMVKGSYWSKMIGAPILLQMGPPEQMYREKSALEESGGAKVSVPRIVRELFEKRLAGLVLRVTEPAREDFEADL